MKIFIKKVPGLVIPKQANAEPPADAGYDIVAMSDPQIIGESFNRPLDDLQLWSKVNYIEYRTGLYIAPAPDTVYNWDGVTDGSNINPSVFDIHFHTLIHPRSSISKYNLVLANSIGLIDGGYRNEILLRFKYMFQPEDMFLVPDAGAMKIYGRVNPETIYKKGDKICQIKACETTPIEFVPVDDLSVTERNMGGFGSSGA